MNEPPVTVDQQYVNGLFSQGQFTTGEFMLKAYYCIYIHRNVAIFESDWSKAVYNSRSEWESCRETHFLYSLAPTKLNSLSPSGVICVTHELPPPLLTSGLWVRHDSRATAGARITRKTSAARSCLRERDSDCRSSFALETTSVETLCADRPAMHETRNEIKTCVSRQRHPTLI